MICDPDISEELGEVVEGIHKAKAGFDSLSDVTLVVLERFKRGLYTEKNVDLDELLCGILAEVKKAGVDDLVQSIASLRIRLARR